MRILDARDKLWRCERVLFVGICVMGQCRRSVIQVGGMIPVDGASS